MPSFSRWRFLFLPSKPQHDTDAVAILLGRLRHLPIKFAFMGFRHGHIRTLYKRVLEREVEGIELSAACEEDEAARGEAESKGVQITHSEFEKMLAYVACDVVAIGDWFGRRGSLAIQALSKGKHVISDKPICTNLDELDEIERLARVHDLKVGCMLTLRDQPYVIGARNLIRDGDIGPIHAIAFGGQHPLNLDSRPAWYFEPGKHGGTIGDIGIHALDCIPWITGLRFSTVNAARCWNAFAREHPHFKDGAQMMLTMQNGCGVIGDVSYFSPFGGGYGLPFYWRMTFWGRRGVLEIADNLSEMVITLDEDRAVSRRALPEGNPGGHLRSFVRDIRGETEEDELCTDSVIRGSRIALVIQKAADENRRDVDLGTYL